ncbi:MAG: nucleoside-diphosphate kinase [Candidatus Micrarchaeota archaeon]|nr:nucleoside-diphosphate kinase [Candidatus Micrarchaeota archaeon]MDE1824511.1 nucleoside-diphosphate kinase [Candidatus Micrarchaeota archaeon]MDE1849531.1 nucleoside-diphosphate kinase [Candidatus Micrarchaeota archaeon]
MERTLILVKPDGVERALIGKVISKYEDAGLKVIGVKMLKPKKETVEKHYADDETWLLSVGRKAKQSYVEKGMKVDETEREIGMRIRSLLMKEITRGPIVAIVFEGNSASEVARKIGGGTEPRKADPSSIRGMYASDSYDLADASKRPVRNILHISENKEIAEKEIKIWFSDSELNDYKRADEEAMYG